MSHRRPFAFRSPLERAFYDAWHARHGASLCCQYRIGPYHADFADPRTQVAIELDGASWHNTPEDRARDRVRDAELRRRGWVVLRFRGDVVRDNLDGCIAIVEATLAGRRMELAPIGTDANGVGRM